MILTVTCNPAWDVTYRLEELVQGQVHRVGEVRTCPGGKGVNVARVLHRLGEDVHALGLGDPDFGAALQELGVPATFLPAMPEVRRTLVVHDARDRTTSLWEPGPEVGAEAVAELVELVAANLSHADAVCVSGSLPAGVPADLPARLASAARAAGVPVVLDLDDAPLAAALAVGGAVLTPNRDELARLVPGSDPLVAAHELAVRNRAPVVLTLGADGLLAAADGRVWHAVGPRVAGNPTGAGDATAAGIVRGLARGAGWPDILRDAAALGAAAVLAPTAGEVAPEAHRTFAAQILVRRVDGALSTES